MLQNLIVENTATQKERERDMSITITSFILLNKMYQIRIQ